MNKTATTTPSGTSPSPESKSHSLRWVILLLGSGALTLSALYAHAYVRCSWEAPQPVPFNHDTHTRADLVGMSCQACHTGAESGAQAGMPTDAGCLDCHRHILAQDARLRPLHAAADADSPVYTGEPLRWQRAHPLPAYVHFDHSVHTTKYDCARCHPSPGQETACLMADCLECHREESELPTDCTQCHR